MAPQVFGDGLAFGVVDAELGVRPAGDDVMMVAGAHVRVDAQRNGSTGIEPPVAVQFHQGAHVDRHPLLQAVTVILLGGVVAGKENLPGLEPRTQAEPHLEGRYRVDMKALVLQDGQQGGVGVGLDGIVQVGLDGGESLPHLPELAANGLLLVHVKRGAEGIGQGLGLAAAQIELIVPHVHRLIP